MMMMMIPCSSISGTFLFYFLSRVLYLFLSRVSILTRDIDIANLSVRLSVHLSVTFRYWMETT